MALTPDQLKLLSTLADRWLAASADERALLLRDARAQGDAFDRAFTAMVSQLKTQSGATLLPPISDAMRDAAMAASLPSNAASSETSATPSLTDIIPTREPGQHVGPYRLIKELGRGGMGVVWLAERADGQHHRQVALKMPLVENLNWLLAARFARERNILASLEHPSIARLYDAGVDQADRNAQPYIAIEYVQGQPITDYVKEKRLKPEATAQLFIRVIEAVAHAHTQLVIHRDIKPSNILVDAKGEPHLLDFGIAKLLDDEDSQTADATQLTRLSGRALTLDYASPEQVNNASLGTASDVYSLGVVLYELLTGSRPYRPKGPTRRDLEQAILDQDPSKPSDQLLTANTGDSESGRFARRMRGDLDTVVLKALRKDPKQRYATAQAFADDLKRYLAYEPIAAKPDAGWYRAGRFVRRNRIGMSAVAGIVLALSAGLVSTLWQANRAANEAQRANAEAAQKEIEALRANASADQARRQAGVASQATERAERALKRAEAESQRARDSAISASLSDSRARNAAAATLVQRNEAIAQKEEAVRQAAAANSEARRADATKDFLFNAFAEAKPSTPNAALPTIVKVTEDAITSARADVNLAADVRVPLLMQLGIVLQAQGRVDDARKLLKENFEDAELRLGSSTTVTLNAGTALARSYTLTGQMKESRALFDALIERSQNALPSVRSPILAGSGVLASKMRERDRAFREASLAVALCGKGCRPEDHIERSSEYANVLQTFGQDAEALQIYRSIDGMVQSRYGENHMRRATLLAAMSTAARALEDFATAEAYAKQALIIDDAVLPINDYRRGLHLYFLALAQRGQRDFKAAFASLQASLAIERVALGSKHADVAYTLNALGFLALQMNDLSAATKYLEEAATLVAETLGANNQQTWVFRANFAYAQGVAGDRERSSKVLDASISALENFAGAEFSALLPAMEKKALLALDRGDAHEALVTYRHIERRVASSATAQNYWKGRLPAGLAWGSLLAGKWSDAQTHLSTATDELIGLRVAPTETAVHVLLLKALLLHQVGNRALYPDAARKARESFNLLTWPPQRLRTLEKSLP